MGISRQFTAALPYYRSGSTGGVLIYDSDENVDSLTSTTPHKIWEITARAAYGSSKVYVTFTTAKISGAGAIAARIYVNDVAVGTNRTTASTFSELITLSGGAEGDRLQIYGAGDGAGTCVRVKPILVRGDISIFEQTLP
jgi:hypothetical protein